MKMNKKGFTLIELLAVIVILAIIALIATPIVMNLITKSQTGADLRSVEAYGKALESAYYQAKLDNPNVEFDTVKDTLTVEVSGNEVTDCDPDLDDTTGEITMTNCKVGGRGPYSYSSKTGADD